MKPFPSRTNFSWTIQRGSDDSKYIFQLGFTTINLYDDDTICECTLDKLLIQIDNESPYTFCRRSNTPEILYLTGDIIYVTLLAASGRKCHDVKFQIYYQLIQSCYLK